MTNDFKLRNGHRTRALSHAISLLNAQACKPLYERRSRLLGDIVHCAYQISAIASERYSGFDEFIVAGIAEKTSQIALGESADRLLGQIGVAPTYRSTWGVWLDHCTRPGFLTFQLPDGSSPSMLMAGEVLSFRGSPGLRQSGIGSLLPIATLAWAVDTEARGIGIYQSTLREHLRILEEDICPSIMAEFTQVPTFARAFNECQTYRDIVTIFPAVSSVLKADLERREDLAVASLLSLAG